MKKQLLLLTLCAHISALFCAASSDDLGGLTQQLASQCTLSDINDLIEPKGRTKLIQATLNNDSAAVLNLMLKKANPHIQEQEYGTTALMIAAGHGYTQIVATLLGLCNDRKTLLTTKTPKGHTAINFATDPEIIEILTQEHNQLNYGPLCKTYFSPNILSAILNCINNERKSVHCAMFRFTHAEPAKALAEKKQLGVDVNIIVDKDYKTDLCLALNYMLKNGISIREGILGSNNEYNSGYFNQHHKYLIFGKNTNRKPLLITGSCNFTFQAFTKNWENMVITDDHEAIEAFKAEHTRLTKSSKKLTQETCFSDKDTNKKGWYSRNDNKVNILK